MRALCNFAILLGLLVCIPLAQAATTATYTPGSEGCTKSFHHDVGAVALIVNAGNLDVCVNYDETERTATGAQYVTVTWNGPAPIGANVITYGVTWNSLSGCTGGSWTVTASNGVLGSSATGHALLTMTALDCLGYVQLTASVPTTAVFVYRDEFPINVRVPELASYVFNCANTGATANAGDPGATTCAQPSTTGSLFVTMAQSGTWNIAMPGGLHVTVDSWPQLQALLSGTITVDGVTFNAGSLNITLPAELLVHNCGAPLNGTCTPVKQVASLDPTDDTLPLVALFVALIYAGYRCLARPWVWLWPFSVLATAFLYYVFKPSHLNIYGAFGLMAGVWLLVMFLNKFGIGPKSEGDPDP